MFIKRMIQSFIVLAAIALPLVLTQVSHAESGCHRNGGANGGGGVTQVDPVQR